MEAIAATNGGEWARQLGLMGERLSKVVEDALQQPGVSVDSARLVLQEMATGIEELRVAEEELTVQADELASSHQAIDAERERYAQLFEFAPDAYLETDGFGKIVEANSAAETMLSVPVRFLAGKLIQSFVAADDKRDVRLALDEVKATPAPVRIEFRLEPRDRPAVPVEARLAAHFDPVTEPDGQVRVRWLLRDISERLRQGREISQLNHDAELVAALAEITQLAAESPDPMVPLLRGLVRLAARAGPGVEAGLTLTDEKDRTLAVAASSPVAEELCRIQVERGGPVSQVLGGGPAREAEAGQLSEWPSLVAAMERHGLTWMRAQPIPTNGGGAGVLTLYGRGTHEGMDHDIELLTEHAAGVIANSRRFRTATELAHHLGTALESRGVIEQAKGILMAWQGCGAERAFDILRRASQRENRKLRSVAEDIVEKAAQARPGRL